MANHADWPAILEAIDAGDRAALLRLTNLVGSLLNRMGGYRQGDGQEDLIQDIVIRLVQSAREGRIQGSFVGYAWTVTRNRLIDVSKARQRQEERTSSSEPDEVEISKSSLHAPAAAADPENRVDLERAMSQLPEEERQVIQAIYLEGHSYEEASERLGVPLGTLKRRQTQALKSLRKKMLVAARNSRSDSGNSPSTSSEPVGRKEVP